MGMNSRAKALVGYNSLAEAVAGGTLGKFQDVSVSEAIVLGMWNQKVRNFFAIFGHGTTDIGEVLRVYEQHGLVKTFNVRHETEAAHAATALKMWSGDKAAVITSIGPGAMQAFAGALAAASNGVGVYHIYGDETTHDEGFNMQQIPKDEQGLFLKLCSVMGEAYSLIEPKSVFTALRRGAVATGKVGTGKPFFLLAPMNVQPSVIKDCNLLEFPEAFVEPKLICGDTAVFASVIEEIRQAKKITIKIGNGAAGCGKELIELANLIDAAIVSGPSSCGIVAYSEPRYMSVGGSKGTLSGNFAMNEADLIIVVGARAVCQWDCSGTAWKHARKIINFNSNAYHAVHYNGAIAVVGDAGMNLRILNSAILDSGCQKQPSEWTQAIFAKRAQWEQFKQRRYLAEPLFDKAWQRAVLTEPAAIKIACDAADAEGYVKFFDAGDVQANGFQIVEDEREKQTITDTGSSYMGLAVSALMAGAVNGKYGVAFSGDGCFMMNPQIMIDAIEHNVNGCIIIFDNRRMAAISGLQQAQYGVDFKTNDSVVVDYVQMAASVQGVNALFGGYSRSSFKQAMATAFEYAGLSVVHVPVYNGEDELGNMGVFGDWNVGNWCERVQAEHHRLGF